MSTNTKSKKRSPNLKSRRSRIDHPFDPAILAKAVRLARQYTIVIRPERDVGYFGSWVEFPYVMGDGQTVQACASMATEALVAVLATMLECGDPRPAPASDEKRSEQVNIRLTAFERLRLETLARQQGFRSISDFIRTTVLSRAS